MKRPTQTAAPRWWRASWRPLLIAAALALTTAPATAQESAFNRCTPSLTPAASLRTPILLHTFSRSNEPIQALRFSRDGKRIAVGQNDHRLRIWDIESDELILETRPLLGPIWSVMFTDDGSHVLSFGPEDRDIPIHVWNVASGVDGRSEDYSIVWGLIDHSGANGAQSRDGRRTFESGRGEGRLTDALQRDIAVIQHGQGFGSLTGAQFSYNDTILALAYSYHTRIFDARTGSERAVLCETANGPPQARMTADGGFLIDTEPSSNETQNVSVWNTTTGDIVARIKISRGSSGAVDISPDGSLVAISFGNGETRIYRIASGA